MTILRVNSLQLSVYSSNAQIHSVINFVDKRCKLLFLVSTVFIEDIRPKIYQYTPSKY